MTKVFLVHIQNKASEPEVIGFASLTEAINKAKDAIYSASDKHSRVKELEAIGYFFLAFNLVDGIAVWVTELQISFSTSSLTQPKNEWQPGWPPQ